MEKTRVLKVPPTRFKIARSVMSVVFSSVNIKFFPSSPRAFGATASARASMSAQQLSATYNLSILIL